MMLLTGKSIKITKAAISGIERNPGQRPTGTCYYGSDWRHVNFSTFITRRNQLLEFMTIGNVIGVMYDKVQWPVDVCIFLDQIGHLTKASMLANSLT
jgi:hypothetical protein